jgi:hypothetical protein
MPDNVERREQIPKIQCVWQTRSAFLRDASECENTASFFHESDDTDLPSGVSSGAVVSVEISFLDCEQTFHVHARVMYRCVEGPRRGLQLRFLEEEKPRQDMVFACAEGEEFPYVRRRTERVPCFFPVRVDVGRSMGFDAVATDLSEGGLRIALTHRLTANTEVDLWLNVPNLQQGLMTRGRVAYSSAEGQQQGAGIEFMFNSSKEREAVRQQVQAIKLLSPA